MSNNLIETDQLIRREADKILHQKGLLSLLMRYGIPHIAGSYVLQLMTWRDLDIYLEADEIVETRFFHLGGQIAATLCPVKMHFRNERIGQTEGLPRGLYWGVYLGDERRGDWKIDIWTLDGDQYQQAIAYEADLTRRLTPETRLSILEIKSQCWQDPGYRRSFSSQDIYRAVLEEGVTSMNEFEAFLNRGGER